MPSPKLGAAQRKGHNAFYPYYPGYSTDFAQSVLQKMVEVAPGKILDPWNGAGTTTVAAAALGLEATGSDLNPAMIMVAKGRLLARGTAPSIAPILSRVISAAEGFKDSNLDDPLLQWLCPRSAIYARSIERAVFELLVDEIYENRERKLFKASDLAAFFYICLFVWLKNHLVAFRSSNPTWVKKAKTSDQRIQIDRNRAFESFKSTVMSLHDELLNSDVVEPSQAARIKIRCSASENLHDSEGTYSVVLTSPPYCTRIDYAVATSPELAILNFSGDSSYGVLRKKLMGASVTGRSYEESLLWGSTCLRFLDRVYRHRSKASRTYYYKSHCQYFDSLYKSIVEVSRVMRSGGVGALVVQNSYYKEILNDLPGICIEMGESSGLKLTSSSSFFVSRSFSRINASSRMYSMEKREFEEVLIFNKL